MPAARGRKPLWCCPRCGAQFVNRNQWHSCGKATMRDWLARMGPRAAVFFARFEAMIGTCGEYHLAPAKSRIAFLGRIRFAGITALSERGMSCSFSLPHPVESPRFARVVEEVPGWWVHRLRITDPEQMDDELQEWLRESYRLVGMRERLGPDPLHAGEAAGG